MNKNIDIAHNSLLNACFSGFATEEERRVMSYAAGLIAANEPIEKAHADAASQAYNLVMGRVWAKRHADEQAAYKARLARQQEMDAELISIKAWLAAAGRKWPKNSECRKAVRAEYRAAHVQV